MAISIPAQSRTLPPLDGDHRWWVLKSAARCTKGVETTSKKKLLITTNSKSRLASSYSSQLRKSSGTRNIRREKSQQAWFPEGAASGRPNSARPKSQAAQHRYKIKPISGRVDRASATEAVDLGSIPGRVIPKTIKIGIHSFPA